MDNHKAHAAFRFPAVPDREGFLLGWRGPQLAGIAVGALLAVVGLNIGGWGGLLFGVTAFSCAGAFVLFPYRGRPLQEWTPLVIRFLIGRWSREARFRTRAAAVGHLVGIPEDGLEPERPGDPRSLPSELAGLEFLEGTLSSFVSTPPFGVVKDTGNGTFTAVLRCQGRAFALLSAEERHDQLAAYAGVLSGMARDRSTATR